MTELSLSDDLIEITAEINIYKQQAGQAVFEIGKRLKHVKDNDLVHGQWIPWLESVDIDRYTAAKMMQAYDQFSNVATSAHLPVGKLFEMLSLPESVDRNDFITTEHTVPSTGETKNVDDMTVKELREVKQQLKDAETRANTIQQEKEYYQKRVTQLQNLPPRIETKTIEVQPHDYNDLRKQASITSELSAENVRLKRSVMEQKEMLTRTEKSDNAMKELKKSLGDVLRNAAMYHENSVFAFTQLNGSREAHNLVISFLNQYSDLCTKQFSEWKDLTAIKAVN